MSPKEKSLELVEKMLLDYDMPYDLAKQCALISVDEIINYLTINEITGDLRNYWKEVKQEIEKL